MADGVIGIRITGDASGLQQSLQGAGREVQAFGSKLRDNADAMGALSNGLKSAFIGSSVAVGIIGLKNTLGELTRAMVDAQIQADKLRNGLNFAVGRGNSAAELDFIRASTKNLGLEFVSTAGQYTKLAAAARGTSLEGAKVRDVFIGIAQASTVMGLSAVETEGALLAVQQMISKGKVQAEELRGQLGERLPGAFQVAARAMGVTTAELDKMLQTGNVLADDFLPRFAAQLTKETAPEVEAASKSMQASVNRLSSAWTDFKQTVTSGPVAEALSGNISGVSETIAGVSEQLRMAKAEGRGLFYQLMQLSGSAVAAMVPLAESPRTLAVQLEAANQKAASLQKRLNSGGDGMYGSLRREIESAERLKQALGEALAKQRELLAGKDGSAYVSGDDRKTAAAAADARAREEKARAQKAARAAFDAANATPFEKYQADLKKNKELLGDSFTPADAKKIYDNYIKSMQAARAVTALSAADKGLNLYNDLLSKGGGYAIDYAEKVGTLSAAFAAKKLTLVELVAAMQVLDADQKINIQTAKDQAEAEKEIADAYQLEVKAYQDKIATLNASASGEAARLQRLQDEEQAASIAAAQNISLAVALEEVGLARVRETYAKEAAEGADRRTLEALREEIAAREKIIGIMGSKEARTAAQEAAKKATDDWKKAAEQIETSISDALMRGFENGKDFAANLRDTVVNMFKTMVLRPIVSAIVNPVAGAVTGALGFGGTANAASTVGGIGNAANAVSAFNMGGLGNPFTNIGGFLSNGVADFGTALMDKGFTSLGSSFESFGLSMKANEAAINGFGDALGYLNAAMLASEGKWGAALGAGIGTFFGGPLGSAIGQAVGGWVDDAFGGGREYTTGSGISGTFGKGAFSGSNYQSWRNDGSSGFFGIGASGSSSGTNYSALDSATTKGLSQGFLALQIASAGMAASLGLDAKRIAEYSQSITLALGSDAAANKKAIEDLFSGIANNLSLAVAPKIADFAKSGETASATLARLSSSITTTNAWLAMLRRRLYDVSLAGADAASKLADAFGGLDQLSVSSKAYYDAYYSSAEKAAASQDAMTRALEAYGYALPASKDALRSMVESLDLTTESGRTAYAALLKLAPQFAETAALIEQLATEAAASMLRTFTAKGGLVPALDATALSLKGVQSGVDVFVGGITQIHAIMLDATSPVLQLGGNVATLSTGLTGAQQSALDLHDQVEALSGASSKAAIDFEGLSGALANLDTTTFAATIGLVFQNLAARITEVMGSIATERVAVREAALAIINPTVMSKQSIAAGIAGINTALPSNSGLIAANTALSAANTAQTQAQSKLTAANASLVNSQDALGTAKTLMANDLTFYKGKVAELYSLASSGGYAVNSYQISGGAIDMNNTAYRYNADTNRFADYGYNSYNSWAGYYGTSAQRPARLALAAVLDQANPKLQANEAAIAAASQSIAVATASIAAAQSGIATTSAAQEAAAQAAAKALLDYQKALQTFTLDAGKSVSKLSKLREETVKYYEAQKALADLMATSAAGLRSTVADYRYSQLSVQDQAASLQAQFATAYAMAQSTQGDGTTLASYADKLNNTLGPLLDKLAETGQGNLIASYLAQAENVAKLLDDNAPKNYQADSLAMLGNIDATLAALDASAKSAEQIISDAIDAGSDRTADGLRAVIAAITGQSIPAFATGAAFTGGVVKRPSLFNMGQMAENGPEAIMPLTNINGSLGVRMAGGGFEALVQQMQELNRMVENMSAETRATAVATGKTARLLERVTPDGNSIQMVAAE